MANESLSQLSDALGIATARLSGDPQRMQMALGMQQSRKLQQQENKLNQFIGENYSEKEQQLLYAVPFAERAKILMGSQKDKSTFERFTVYDINTGKSVGSINKADANKVDLNKFRLGPLVNPYAKGGATSDPLRTVTKGGKVSYNIRDSELTKEKVATINTAGEVIQPLGFTEKFESTEDIDFDPVKKKYLATEQIIVSTSELAQKFADEPTSALRVGNAAQFIDSVIQNVDAGLDILSNAEDTKMYKFVQEGGKSIEGTDFTDRIKEVSGATGVSESRIRDLSYLFAAARGQEGKGLSDKDYENALRIVSGGVGVEGRTKVLADVAGRLRDEFYREIEFDVATSTNQDYVNRLKTLPKLSTFIDPFAQQTPSTTPEDPLGIR